ncbi:MAG: UDP-N-acetylmuramoyl-L-alanyl-D-glutamate--2,6-diaminopimelate ligase, partial [Alloprevotella sp.]|nr:UDP-N-acetylmuramoyl-L-alanyl-D-glutamate--2,6-diaminopimelate ligase [Alloprevotella sp.]
MKLAQLLERVAILSSKGTLDAEITGIETDSRQVKAGNLFVAVKGTQTDGHAYIDKAVAAGAAAILVMDMPDDVPADSTVTYVQVADTEAIVGEVATTFYGNPTARLRLVGVTGTNGKTTIATLLYHMFRAMGHKCGLCSTVCNYIDGEAVPTEHTTPDPITLNRLLARMADAGCEYAFMECSSHAIHQHRIGGLTFAGGIFTNLTRDHLDYHKTFENYRDAKKAFFDALPATAFAITNADDRNGMVMVQNCKAAVRTYSTRAAADIKGRIVEESIEGMLISIDGTEVSVAFVGRFNVSNLLAVYGAALMLGKERGEVLRILSTLKPVNGRF